MVQPIDSTAHKLEHRPEHKPEHKLEPHWPVRLAIFDFDGTLADTFPFFVSVFNEIALRHRFRTVEREEFARMRTLSAREAMRDVGLPLWKLPFVSRTFLGMMKARAGDVALFPGVDSMLAQLVAAGTDIAIVSSNSRENIVKILGPHNTALITQFECGASLFGKARLLKRVVRKAGVRAEDAIYVGDQSTDHDAATAAGVAFGAVAWGFADMAALRSRVPEREFDQLAELARLGFTRRSPKECL